MNESSILADIRLALGSRPDTRVWRQQSGNFLLADGRRIICGIPGMSDLGGIRSVVIGPEHVGQTLAVYVGIECKSARGVTRKQQQSWLDMLQARGALAGIARSVADAITIIESGPTGEGRK